MDPMEFWLTEISIWGRSAVAFTGARTPIFERDRMSTASSTVALCTTFFARNSERDFMYCSAATDVPMKALTSFRIVFSPRPMA